MKVLSLSPIHVCGVHLFGRVCTLRYIDEKNKKYKRKRQPPYDPHHLESTWKQGSLLQLTSMKCWLKCPHTTNIFIGIWNLYLINVYRASFVIFIISNQSYLVSCFSLALELMSILLLHSKSVASQFNVSLHYFIQGWAFCPLGVPRFARFFIPAFHTIKFWCLDHGIENPAPHRWTCKPFSRL